MTGAKALMTAMEKEGVKDVFGLPGGANLPMYDEFARCDIRHILTRHEQSAAHMADGFGRVSRKPGVCFATSGASPPLIKRPRFFPPGIFLRGRCMKRDCQRRF